MLRTKPNNPRYPHTVRIVRKEYTDNPFDGEVVERVLYEGVARCYTDTTTVGGNEVAENRRKISIPVRFDEWEEPILAGDKVFTTVGEIHEEWNVSDFEPDNDRTVVYCEMVRN